MAKLRVTQVRSLIGSTVVELEDSPSVQGALRKVRHLVEVEEVK